MPFTLILIALFALAFLVFNVVLCVRVWRMAELPRWRRLLPALLLCTALAASAGRAWDITAVAEAVAFPLNAATALLGMYEVDRRRRRERSGVAS
ncbi:hypothetical protein ACFFSH_36615 [Streptomyces filamentosus]|uniref:Uncharacterized protein n=1 Tax=Streptomyces filamentosus TaxID=67294 RepID=A0A919BC75_STRFL|nr:hypothetical protein [Streptomyces filamentosus]GHF78414.1 hypothetical protein GCM10017667_02230 [Streptomyces filamentosus]